VTVSDSSWARAGLGHFVE